MSRSQLRDTVPDTDKATQKAHRGIFVSPGVSLKGTAFIGTSR
jgi:hypothetical protein